MTKLAAIKVAEICHEAHRAYARALGEQPLPPWDEAPDEHKASLLEGVELLMRQPGIPCFMLHQRWVQRKLKEGWTLGPKIDREAKTHPCLVEWSELPEAQRRKDLLFHNIIFALETEL